MNLLRLVRNLLLFLAGFAAVSMGLERMVPGSQRLEFYRHLKDDVEVVFLGTSHVYRQLDPNLFDRVRGADEGHRSLNLGEVGMDFSEEHYNLRRILEEDAPKLRWVVIEARPYALEMQNENDFGLRRIRWHDWATTWDLLWSVWESDLDWEVKRDLWRRHLEHWWRRRIHLARGLDAVMALDDPPFSLEGRPGIGVRKDGFFPLENATADEKQLARNRRFRARPQEMLRMARELVDADDGGPPTDRLLRKVREMEALAEEHEVGLIWWMHPNLERFRGWRQMQADGEIRYLISHDDPVAYPEFYKVQNRYDKHHLNLPGSRLLTRRLAEQFQQIVEEDGDR